MVEGTEFNIKTRVIGGTVELKSMGIPPFIIIRTGCFPNAFPIYSENHLNAAMRELAHLSGVFVLRVSDGKLYDNLCSLYEDNKMDRVFPET